MAPAHRCFLNRYLFEYRQWNSMFYWNSRFLCLVRDLQYIHANVFDAPVIDVIFPALDI